ncbi:MAG: hypothetical protein AMJ54_15070 [Deltaproteobacteria bacterium SG8_13]|nr:MAG: hypothetical protein AMJ54_15070 [Deltaproteobacteria bacterium SG8_13]
MAIGAQPCGTSLCLSLIFDIITAGCIIKTCAAYHSRIERSGIAGRVREVYMGKYIAYTLVVLVVLFFLEWFQIVDIPYVDLPNLAEQQKEAVEKSEDNMRRRFGD